MIFEQNKRLISFLVLLFSLIGALLLVAVTPFTTRLGQAETEPPRIVIHQNLSSPGYISAIDNITDDPSGNSSQISTRHYAVVDSQSACDENAFNNDQGTAYEKGDYIEITAEVGGIYCFRVNVQTGGDTYDIYKPSSPVGSVKIDIARNSSQIEEEPDFISAQVSGLKNPDIKYVFMVEEPASACNYDSLTEAHKQPQSKTLLYNITGRLVDYKEGQEITLEPRHLDMTACFIANEKAEFFYKKAEKITFQAIRISETVVKIKEQNAKHEFTARDTYNDDGQSTDWLYKFIAGNQNCDGQMIAESGLPYKEGEPITLGANDHGYNGMRICFLSNPKTGDSGDNLIGRTSIIQIDKPPNEEATETPSSEGDNPLKNLIITITWIVGLVIIFGLVYFYLKKIRDKRE